MYLLSTGVHNAEREGVLLFPHYGLLLSINVLLVLPAVVMSLVERVSCDFSFINLAIRVSSSTTLALSFSYFAINRIN